MVGSVVLTVFAIENKYVYGRLNYNVLPEELHLQALCCLRLLQHPFPHYRRYGELKLKVCQFIFLGRDKERDSRICWSGLHLVWGEKPQNFAGRYQSRMGDHSTHLTDT